MLRLAAATRTRASASSVPTARPIATLVATPRWVSVGFTTNATSEMTGSTSQPVSRSRTTDANVPGASPVSRARRETRRTSPPIVLGSTFPTN
jgi:hypothetical protein